MEVLLIPMKEMNPFTFTAEKLKKNVNTGSTLKILTSMKHIVIT